MNRIFWSLLIGFLVIGGIGVFQATRSSSSLVLMPSELVARTDGASPQELSRIRVAGKVSGDSIRYQLDPLELRFSIRDPGKGPAGSAAHEGPVVDVLYKNLKPDMFAEDRDVIIDGEFIPAKGPGGTGRGVLMAHSLQTQCPSKYEPAKPTQH